MDKQKEIKSIAKEICSYVKSKNITSVAVVAKSPYLKYLHNTGIAEWLVKKGYGDIKAAVKEFASKVKELIHGFENISQSTDDCLCEKIDELIEKEYGDGV